MKEENTRTMVDHRKQMEEYIQNEIPRSYESSKISEMYAKLETDMAQLKTRSPGMNQKSMEVVLHQKHKQFSISYPNLFFKMVRGEVDRKMFKSLLDLKQGLDENQISLAAARNRVIDCAKNDIAENKNKPRAKRDKLPGTVVQELSFECKPDES